MIDRTATVAELVLERPGRARVLEDLGIDYCCGGQRSLDAVCAERGLAVDEVITRLETQVAEPREATDWTAVPLRDLCEHIVSVHHVYLRDELPRLSELIGKVLRAHAGELTYIEELRAVFDSLRAELEEHMQKEEQLLFPICMELEQTGEADGVDAPIAVLEHEHDEAGAALRRLGELTDDYELGQALCNTHRALLEGLETLEKDLHQHIHEENNILFPRALALAV